MNTNFTNVDAVSTINYQFTAIPTNFIYLMDNDCFKLFAILLQKETYWNNKGMLKDGYFIKSITELGEEMNIKNRKDIRLIIEALYRKGLISIQVQPQKHNTAKFKLNWNKINEYLDKSIYDLMEFEERIIKLNRNETITYTNNVTDNVTNYVTNNDTKCTTTKDNINKIDNIKNKNNINKEINNINIYTSNILEENSEEIGLIENPISENNKEENNLNIKEVGFVDNPTSDIEETNDTPTMTAKFEKNLNLLLDKLNLCASIEELEDKVVKLCNWIETCNASYTSTELDSIKEKIASTYSINKDRLEEMETSIEDDFFNNSTTQINKEEKEATTPSKSKEQFIADLEEYKNTIINQDNLEDAKQQFKMFCNLKDKEIREFELIPMVADIIKELDAQINANKTFLTTFNLQETESITEANKTQENALNSLRSISYVVDDTEDYPF